MSVHTTYDVRFVSCGEESSIKRLWGESRVRDLKSKWGRCVASQEGQKAHILLGNTSCTCWVFHANTSTTHGFFTQGKMHSARRKAHCTNSRACCLPGPQLKDAHKFRGDKHTSSH